MIFLATSEILLTSRKTAERRITTVTMRVITTDRKLYGVAPKLHDKSEENSDLEQMSVAA